MFFKNLKKCIINRIKYVEGSIYAFSSFSRLWPYISNAFYKALFKF